MGKWGAWADNASCGKNECMVHRIQNDKIQVKYIEFQWKGLICESYSSEELRMLRSVANAMG